MVCVISQLAAHANLRVGHGSMKQALCTYHTIIQATNGAPVGAAYVRAGSAASIVRADSFGNARKRNKLICQLLPYGKTGFKV